MAEMRTQRGDAPMPHSDVHGAENLGDRPADHLPAGHALPGGTPRRTDPAAVASGDPQAVRSEIENTRERMSETIEEIETVLARKREQLQDRLDVLAPVRERPLPATGIAFGVGLALGLLTGGGDHSDDHDSHARARPLGTGAAGIGMSLDVQGERHDHLTGDAADRAAMWENRARRLLRVARRQEEKIRELQERYGALYTREVELGAWEDDEKAAGELMASVGSLRDTVLHGLTGFLTDAFHQMAKGGSSGSSQHA